MDQQAHARMVRHSAGIVASVVPAGTGWCAWANPAVPAGLLSIAPTGARVDFSGKKSSASSARGRSHSAGLRGDFSGSAMAILLTCCAGC